MSEKDIQELIDEFSQRHSEFSRNSILFLTEDEAQSKYWEGKASECSFIMRKLMEILDVKF